MEGAVQATWRVRESAWRGTFSVTTVLHFQLLRVRAAINLALNVNRVLNRQGLATRRAFEACTVHGPVIEDELVYQVDLLVADIAAL